MVYFLRQMKLFFLRAAEAMSTRRTPEKKEGWRAEGGGEKSLLMILHFNYFCKYRRPGLLGEPVSRFFISRADVRCLGPASRLASDAGVPAVGHEGITPPSTSTTLTSNTHACTHPSSFIFLMDIPPQTSASLPDCNPLKFNSLYI